MKCKSIQDIQKNNTGRIALRKSHELKKKYLEAIILFL